MIGRLSMLSILMPLIMLAALARAEETSGQALAFALRPNVVKIIAVLRPGSPARRGFGFIIGKRNNQAIIVTANHVVRDENDPDAVDKAPRVVYFEDQGVEVTGTLTNSSTSQDHGDVAVVLAPWSSGISFVELAQSEYAAKREDDVWPIGRNGSWSIPVNPGKVSAVDPLDRHIEVESLSITVGSSGGPIVSKNGIVGMIVVDNPTAFHVKATPIEAIETLLRDEWRYEWNMKKIASVSALPNRFKHATGFFIREGDNWVEYPSHQYGNFTFESQGVIDGYLYLVDRTRVKTVDGVPDQNRPVTLRLPLKGGWSQWGYPNPYIWQNLYIVTPER